MVLEKASVGEGLEVDDRGAAAARASFRGLSDKAYPEMTKNTQTIGGPWNQRRMMGSFMML